MNDTLQHGRERERTEIQWPPRKSDNFSVLYCTTVLGRLGPGRLGPGRLGPGDVWAQETFGPRGCLGPGDVWAQQDGPRGRICLWMGLILVSIY